MTTDPTDRSIDPNPDSTTDPATGPNPAAGEAVDEAVSGELVVRVAEALRTSRLSWGLHADRWGDVEWQRDFWTEAAQIALVAAHASDEAARTEATMSAAGTVEPGDLVEPGESVVAATGNGMKSHDTYDTFLDVSGGSGNHADDAEVHLRLRSNDGHNEGQSWFPARELVAAIRRAAPAAFAPDTDSVECGGVPS